MRLANCNDVTKPGWSSDWQCLQEMNGVPMNNSFMSLIAALQRNGWRWEEVCVQNSLHFINLKQTIWPNSVKNSLLERILFKEI